GTAGGGADPRSDGRGRAQLPPGQGRGAEPDQSAARLRLSSTLPTGGRGLPAATAGAQGIATRALGGLQRGPLREGTRCPRRSLLGGALMRAMTGMAAALLAASTAAGAALADAPKETPKRGGTMTYMIPADAPPSLDGHRETTYATAHAAA